jgi:hypothetical protein
MKHSVQVIFGKEQALKASNKEPFTEEELRLNVKVFDFDTREEKLAFIKGLNEGVGWTEICIPELELTANH